MASKLTAIVFAGDDVCTAVPLLLRLQDHGFRALHAPDAGWALRLARSAQPDLILLAVDLPCPDGLAVCRALNQSGASHLSWGHTRMELLSHGVLVAQPAFIGERATPGVSEFRRAKGVARRQCRRLPDDSGTHPPQSRSPLLPRLQNDG